MQIAVYSRAGIVHKGNELQNLLNALCDNDITYCVNNEFADVISEKTGVIPPSYTTCDELPDSVEMMISYGGDGTFLDTVRVLNNRSIPILGVNSGRLGFLANVSKEDVLLALKEVVAGNYTLEQRTMLFVEGDFGGTPDFPYAFNEFSVQRSEVAMVSVDVYVDNELITTYHGDGVILSTASGSTAYSLSVGGPIVAPDSRCFVLAPIASHNLTMRPVVLPDSSEMRFRVLSRSGKSYATLDNRSFEIENNTLFTIKKAEKSVTLVKPKNISFYRTLRDKMMWGVDNREGKK